MKHFPRLDFPSNLPFFCVRLIQYYPFFGWRQLADSRRSPRAPKGFVPAFSNFERVPVLQDSYSVLSPLPVVGAVAKKCK
jgi:hypothetical protein